MRCAIEWLNVPQSNITSPATYTSPANSYSPFPPLTIACTTCTSRSWSCSIASLPETALAPPSHDLDGLIVAQSSNRDTKGAILPLLEFTD